MASSLRWLSCSNYSK